MTYTKQTLQQDLAARGLTGTETILIHSSMKAIGVVEGGADTVLDVCIAGAEFREPIQNATIPLRVLKTRRGLFCAGPFRKGKIMVYCVEENLNLEEKR